MAVDLVWIDRQPAAPSAWAAGRVTHAPPDPAALSQAVAQLDGPLGPDDAVLFWSAALGQPDPDAIAALLDQPDDVWHAGLRLGTGGSPSTLDSVAGTWMLSRDLDPDQEGTSWRLSLDACLVRWRVLQAVGFLDTSFDSAAGAALELGHRWVWQGVRTRHVPGLVGADLPVPPTPAIPLADELRFVRRRFPVRWYGWASMRSALHGRRPAHRVLATAWRLRDEVADVELACSGADAKGHLPAQRSDAGPADTAAKVTVLVPTVERYPYLRVVLEQLRAQEPPPHQVVVVDQTPKADRDHKLRGEFADLPLTWLERDVAGQCSARNAGLDATTGDHVLFIDDDDDDLAPDLIARHVANLRDLGLDVSSGGVHEPEAGEAPEEFRRFRVSDTFPTNNTMVRREALERSGWFDLAYDRGERADHDLGMRLYLAGCRMAFDPTITVLHHHAPRGGLRVHRARAITYGSSRRSIFVRQRLSPTQLYLWRRYYSPAQQREAELLHLAGVVNGSGSLGQRLARVAAQLVLLPSTIRAVERNLKLADDLAARFPVIPHSPNPAEAVAVGAGGATR